MLKFENKSNGRYYYIYVQRDLFDDSVLCVLRGGKHSRIVRYVKHGCLSAIQNEIERLSKKRKQRGYELIEN